MSLRRATYFGRFTLITSFVLSWLMPSPSLIRSALADEQFPETVPAVKTYELTVSAAKEPNPALKYRFLLPLSDRVAGNAADFYKRAIIGFLDGAPKEAEMQAWSELPLDQFPLEKARSYVAERERLFDAIKVASQCDHCDWGTGSKICAVRMSSRSV